MNENVYQPPGANEPIEPESSGFGKFDLERAFSLGWHARKNNIGFGIGYTLLLFLLCFGAVLTCVGIVLALPHLVASTAIVGLLMVRGRVAIGDMFRPFESFGSILGAFLLIYIVQQILALVFALPYYYLLLENMNWAEIQNSPLIDQMQKVLQHIQTEQGQMNVSHLAANMFSLLNLPISLFIAARMSLTYVLIMERKTPAIDAIKTSWRVTAPYQWPLLALGVIAMLVGFVGFFGCCIGILFTFPLAVAMQGAATYQLLGEDDGRPLT